MAEKKNKVTFESVMADIKARRLAPVYLLMGAEGYFIDRISAAIEESVLAPEEKDFNQTVVYGIDTTPVQIADMARRFPMMAEYQVIIVKEAQNLKGWEPLEKYCEKPVPSTILVLCYKNGTIDRRKKIVTRAAQTGVLFESARLKDNEIMPFVNRYLTSHGAEADPKAAQMVADHIGADVSRLCSELDKVMISLPADHRKVTPEIVEREIGVSKDYNPFELKNAIVNKDIVKANRIVKYFNKNPKAASLYSILPLLFSYFQNLMIAHYVKDKTNQRAVAQELGLSSEWGVKDYMTGMKNYTAVKTLNIIHKMREIDAKSKGLDNPNTGADELLRELIFFILH